MSRLQILTWFWHQDGGRAQFKPEHVNIWAAMVRRHCSLDFDLACVTNIPEGIDPSIRIIESPGFYDDLKTSRWAGGRPSCYRRLAMFHPDAAEIFGERFVSMDLDLVISDSIDSILDRDEDFIINGPSQIGPRWIYNGSMIMMDAGSRPFVYEDFTPEQAEIASRQYVGSDQAWLAFSLGQGEATWGEADGVVRWGEDKAGALMFFPGNIKPWNAIAHPHVAAHYRLERGGKALIIGERKHVWDDVHDALGHGPFQQVIALPKSARLWRGTLHHVAEDLKHAKLIAQMMGSDEIFVCGE